MTAVTTTTDADLDLSVIEHLDFTPTLPCEHSRHTETHPDAPAALIVESRCPHCTQVPVVRYAICRGGWTRLFIYGVACVGCGVHGPRDDFLTLIAEI